MTAVGVGVVPLPQELLDISEVQVYGADGLLRPSRDDDEAGVGGRVTSLEESLPEDLRGTVVPDEALKALPAEYSEDPVRRERLTREALKGGKVWNEIHVVTCRLGFAEWQTIQATQMFLARYMRAVADPNHQADW